MMRFDITDPVVGVGFDTGWYLAGVAFVLANVLVAAYCLLTATKGNVRGAALAALLWFPAALGSDLVLTGFDLAGPGESPFDRAVDGFTIYLLPSLLASVVGFGIRLGVASLRNARRPV